MRHMTTIKKTEHLIQKCCQSVVLHINSLTVPEWKTCVM